MTDNAQYSLTAQIRPPRPKPHILLQEGFIPGTLYGRGFESINIQLKKTDFLPLFKEVGQTSMIELRLDDKQAKHNVLIHQLQYNHLTGEIIHVELFKVSLTETITTSIPLLIVGDSPACQKEAVPLQNLQEVEVECFPQDLINEIEVDISGIEQIDDSIHVKDLPIPSNITILTNLEELVFKALAPQQEEEEEEEESLLDHDAEPEVLTEKKEDETQTEPAEE
ncbi:MAG TPA: 50S ribosomal protein L25 [Candidatus Wirthbacteria bacterium]|nr:50S ribosomal protein L25 [Candidatus Wirthbacteria bacterium]